MRRFMKWLLLGFNLLMIVWIIAGIASNNNSTADCGTLSAEACDAAGDVGTTIGVGILIVLWALGDIILGVLYLISPSKKRDCPVCGKGVKKGVLQCGSCGYDYRTGQAPVQPAQWKEAES